MNKLEKLNFQVIETAALDTIKGGSKKKDIIASDSDIISKKKDTYL